MLWRSPSKHKSPKCCPTLGGVRARGSVISCEADMHFEGEATECEVVASDGALLYAWACGEGNPVLLIHGACVDSSFFAEAASLMAASFRVISYDRRGSGKSTLPDAERPDCSIARQADDAWCVMRRLAEGGGAPVGIVACSAGCSIGLELATRHPEAVSALVLHEPAIFDCLPPEHPAWRVVHEAMALADEGLFTLPVSMLFSLESIDDARIRRSSGCTAGMQDKNMGQFLSYDSAAVYRFVPDYSSVPSVPIAVGLGELSGSTYHTLNCPELARRVGGTLVRFPGGHNCALDLPREFSAVVCGLLALAV